MTSTSSTIDTHPGALHCLSDFAQAVRDDVDHIWDALDVAVGDLDGPGDELWQRRWPELCQKYAHASVDLVRILDELDRWVAKLHQLGIVDSCGCLLDRSGQDSRNRVKSPAALIMRLERERDGYRQEAEQHAKEATAHAERIAQLEAELASAAESGRQERLTEGERKAAQVDA